MSVSHTLPGQMIEVVRGADALPVPTSGADGAAMPSDGLMPSQARLLLRAEDGAPVLSGPVRVYVRIGEVWYADIVVDGDGGGGSDVDLGNAGLAVRVSPSPHWRRIAISAAAIDGGTVTAELAFEELPRW